MQPSLLTRIRWRLEELRHLDDAKVIGGLVLMLALAGGGFLAARMATRASAHADAATRIVTVRQKVRVHEHGRVVTRWRVRRLYSQALTVLSTQTIRTPNGVHLVMRPVTRDRVVYRNHPVASPARTITATHEVTDTQPVTVTQRVTQIETTTAVSTVTDTLPITVTVTVPIP